MLGVIVWLSALSGLVLVHLGVSCSKACPMKYVYMDQKDPRSMTGSMGHDPPAYNERCANIDAAILPNYQEATYKWFAVT